MSLPKGDLQVTCVLPTLSGCRHSASFASLQEQPKVFSLRWFYLFGVFVCLFLMHTGQCSGVTSLLRYSYSQCTGNRLGYWGFNLYQPCAKQIHYWLYYHSGPSYGFNRRKLERFMPHPHPCPLPSTIQLH